MDVAVMALRIVRKTEMDTNPAGAGLMRNRSTAPA
jgi:hypothetical protein